MKAIKFDQLPDLCLRKIIAFLNLRDRIKCRAVNRQFKFYADRAGVTELIVTDETTECGEWCKNWCQTDRPMDHGNLISPRAFASVKAPPFKLDQRLKFLHIHLDSDLEFEHLNTFQQLVHLELHSFGEDDEDDKPNTVQTLNLLNLKLLYCSRLGSDVLLVLKTPKLEVLVSCRQEISSIRADYPETIKRLECDFGDENVLATFKNLQVLVFDFCSVSDLNEIRLSNWKDLKELQIQFYNLSETKFEEFRSSVNVIRQRAESKRIELKLYLEDVLLVDAEQLKDYKPLVSFQNNWFKFKNFRLLRDDSYPTVLIVNFNELMELDVELSSDFFDRFPRIQRLIATAPVDRDRFEWFLQKATAVCELFLIDTSLDQTFLDRLPKINSRLTCLEVNGGSGLITNFNFVLQFEPLLAFRTDRGLVSLNLAAKAFQQLKELFSFDFRAGSERVEIDRFPPINNVYTLRIGPVDHTDFSKRFRKRNLKWPELVDFYVQTRTGSTARRKNAAKIKRARL